MTDGGGIDEAVLAMRGLARGPARWLWDHWPALAGAKALGGRPDWQHLAAVMTKDGVKTRHGTKLKSETVRRTFRRVADVVAEHGYQPVVARPAPSPPLRRAPGEFAPGVRLALPLAKSARRDDWQDD